MTLTDDQLETVINTLRVRGANLPCPRCSNKQFAVINSRTFQR